VGVSVVGFDYELRGSGWADATLTIGERTATLSASYLGDALGELLDALVSLTRGSTHARASWDQEPGEYRWVFSRRDQQVRVQVLYLPEWRGVADASDDQGEVVLDGVCTLTALSEAVTNAAQRVLDRYGEAGYRAKWVQHDFPVAALRELKQTQSG
jgi:hypothetical protein